jgi:hypothetical protein
METRGRKHYVRRFEAECAVRKSLGVKKFETGSKVSYPQIRQFSLGFCVWKRGDRCGAQIGPVPDAACDRNQLV